MSLATGAPARLYLVPNLLGLVPPESVLPERTLAVARRLRHFVVETPKIARQFLKTIGSAHPLQAIQMTELDEHTRGSDVEQLLAPALAGEELGLLSDAGCPGIADPGAALVAAAHEAGVPVVPLVGPSAILLALIASGMNGQAFAFHGYLPAKPGPRAAAVSALDAAVRRTGATQLFIETPYRNEAVVDAVIAGSSAGLRFCAAADLSLPSEQILCRTITDWRRRPRPALAKRPAIFLLGR
jgi:16S rRNA (cytidine1402-2'-O)-methyltransferase